MVDVSLSPEYTHEQSSESHLTEQVEEGFSKS